MFDFIRCIPVGCCACPLEAEKAPECDSAQQHHSAGWWHVHCGARSSAVTAQSQPSVLATGDRPAVGLPLGGHKSTPSRQNCPLRAGVARRPPHPAASNDHSRQRAQTLALAARSCGPRPHKDRWRQDEDYFLLTQPRTLADVPAALSDCPVELRLIIQIHADAKGKGSARPLSLVF